MNEEPGVTDVLLQPLTAQYQLIVHGEETRAVLDASNPHALAQCLEAGEREVQSRWGAHISLGAQQALFSWRSRHAARYRELQDLWDALDAYDRNGIVQGLLLGVTSEDAQVGAAVGALFGPIGSVVGGALGGFLAGSKKDEEIARARQKFFGELGRRWDELAADYDENIMPLVHADLARVETAEGDGDASFTFGTGLVGAMLGVLVLLVLHWIVAGIFFRDGMTATSLDELLTTFAPLWVYIVGGIWCLLMGLLVDGGMGKKALVVVVLAGVAHVEIQGTSWGMLALLGDAPKQSAAEPTASDAPTSRPKTKESPIVGRWRDNTGVVLQAVARSGGGAALRLEELGNLGSAGYRVGDTYLTLTPDGKADGSYQAEYMFRPTPPSGVTFAESSSATCQELISEVSGKPITASLDGDRLSIRLPRVEIAPGALKLQGIKVVECKQFTITKSSVVEYALTRHSMTTE